jgi:hypothetical protein
MANQHFAKLADVWKHLVLCDVLDAVRPTIYAESHSGSAWYALTPSAQRSYGVYRFVEQAPSSPALAGSRYLRSLHRLKGEEGLSRYAGSATFAMLELGSDARYVLCDLDDQSASSLTDVAEELHLSRRVEVVAEDGPSAVWHRLERWEDPAAWAIHVDPFEPHASATPESPSAVDLARLCADRGATVVYWVRGGGVFDVGPTGGRARTPQRCDRLVRNLSYPEEDFDSPIIGCGVVGVGGNERLPDRLDALGRGIETIYADAGLPSGAVGSVTFERETWKA